MTLETVNGAGAVSFGRDADELYAKLPLGAVSLESELQRSGRIAVQTTVSGQRELRG